MTININTQNNDQYQKIALHDTEYLIRTTYNAAFDYWALSFFHSDGSPIFMMKKLVPNFPINFFLAEQRGMFGVLTSLERVGRDDFKTGKARLVYVE
jgi:hypothetical protein